VVIDGVYAENFTEQGGSYTDDSDVIKVFGGKEVGYTCSADIKNVKCINNGKSLKRVIKTQVDYTRINNVELRIKDATCRGLIDIQYGNSDISNINIYADNANPGTSGLIGQNSTYLESINIHNSSLKNVSVIGINDSTLSGFYGLFAIGTESTANAFSYIMENISILGFDFFGDNLNFIRSTFSTNNTNLIFKNIDCSTLNTTFNSFSSGRSNSLNTDILYANATFENVKFPSPTIINGTYASNSVIYSNILPSNIINSNIYSNNRVITRYPNSTNSIYKYNMSYQSSVSGETIIYSPSISTYDFLKVKIVNNGNQYTMATLEFYIRYDTRISTYKIFNTVS
jgi:hypothetical protein